MKHVYYCRHGESVLNVQRIYAGQIDTPLTDYGRQQAEQAGLGAVGLDVGLIVSSPLVRALETAQIIARKIDYPVNDILINKLFEEQSYGSLSGQSWDVVADPEMFHDIESDASLAARAQAAYDYIQSLDVDSILVVAHGSFAKPFCALFGFQAGGEELPNAQIVQLA